MNNWRLLLLALVAVFQPITSLTKSNLVDGRQQCCDRRTDTQFTDSRPSFYGTERLGKASSPENRLNIRDETREDRQLRQRDTASIRRSLLNIRERDERRSRSAITRSNRVADRSDRIAGYDNIERVIDLQRRNRVAGARVSMKRYNVRTNELSLRNFLYREDNRINRLSNERQERDHFQRTNMHITSENMGRQTPIRAIRDTRMTREDFDRISVGVSRDSRREIARDRVSRLQRRTVTRDDVKRDVSSHNERHELERHAEQRRSLSENSRIVQRVRNLQVNSGEERRENVERFNVNPRLMTERLEERRQQHDDRTQSREEIRENTDRRISRERIQMDRRGIRDSRLMNDRNVRHGNMETRRDTRHNERQSRETRGDQLFRDRRVESRGSRRLPERNNLVRNQRARSVAFERFEGNKVDSRLSRSVEVLTLREDATPQFRTDRRRQRDTADRIRNVESARVRDVMINKMETKNEAIANWQYLFYTVQAAYLCGLAIQMLTPNHSEKSKSMSLRWWPSSTQRLIKVD